jgi:hypothetical protein
MMVRVACLVVLATRVTPAPADDKVSGFVASEDDPLDGRVTDAAGHPVAGVEVHVVSTTGSERVVTTDRDGRYHAERRRGERSAIVFVYGDRRIGAIAVATVAIPEGEAIAIQELVPPAVFPRPRSSSDIVPEYSETARDADRWTRAWLLLDISETGDVTRLRFLNRPGLGLDDIAMRDAFKLKFDPARNRADRAIRAQVLWTFEWPAFWWLHHHRADLRHMPASVVDVPCRGTGPTTSVYRDCSRPNLANALREPWIDKP